MEKRALSRVVLQMDAAVRWRDGGVEGQVENLSLRGAFVSAGEKPPPQAPVDVTIRLSGPTSELSVRAKGLVARTEDRGFAVVFGEIGLDSFLHLKNVISYQNGDPEKVAAELADLLKSRT